MKLKNSILILVLLPCICTNAENVEHENILSFNYGGIWIQDQYLSPLEYTGMKIGVTNEWWQPFQKVKEEHWQHVGAINLQFGWMYNSSQTNVIYAPGLELGWGGNYHWIFPKKHLKIYLGPYLDIDFLGKIHGNHVNKPFSIDGNIDLMAMGGVIWSFRGERCMYRLNYSAKFNIIGMDFVPDYWESYYEMSEGVTGKIRCSGMWNHRTIRQNITLDIQFKKTRWRIGLMHEYIEYGTKAMMFSREQVAAIFGTSFTYQVNKPKDYMIFK